MIHDCGHMPDSWQCKGSHLPTSEKVPPSLREPRDPEPNHVTMQKKAERRPQKVSRETSGETNHKRPLKDWIAELSESKKAAK